MKLLMINNLYFPHMIGGAEKVVQLTAEGLVKYGLEPIIVCTGPRDYIDNINGIKVYRFFQRNIYWFFENRRHNLLSSAIWHLLDMYNPAMQHRIEMVIKKEQPHLVHTTNLAGFSVSAWKAVKNCSLPLIHTLHDYYLRCPRSTMFKYNKNCSTSCFQCSFFSIPKRALSSLVDYVIGISSFILDKHCMAGYFPHSPKNVIWNPVVTPQIKHKSSPKIPIRFGYIGRFHQTKGIETLLSIFSNIDSHKATLTLAGTGDESYVSSLRQRYSAQHIVFLGFVPPDKLYEQIDILVVPSLWEEPFGMVVVEAFSRGIPVIGARRGGISELIDDGKTGFLFEPTNRGELGRIINLFLSDLSLFHEMTLNCFIKSKDFSIENICSKYSRLYSSF
jgi:glycosyltransferase involved in cell wall biosynthesis